MGVILLYFSQSSYFTFSDKCEYFKSTDMLKILICIVVKKKKLSIKFHPNSFKKKINKPPKLK